jgi:hypothetical protein
VKIYIHHFYKKSLFYKIAHNSVNRFYDIKNGEGTIKCEYKNVQFEIIFKQEISFENDGYHLLDYFTSFFYGEEDPKIGRIEPDTNYMERESQQILKAFIKILKNCPPNQKWIITYFRTEKILQTKDTSIDDSNWMEIESLMDELKNHHFITDNIFLNENLKNQHPNFYYSLTNTVFQWNEIIAIRWYYEFKQIYDKLSFDYDLMYSIKNHKINRVKIINELSKLKKDRLYLQHSDSLQNPSYQKNAPEIEHINKNSVVGETDFSDISWITNHQGYMDVFFRVLPKAKMQILCESWSWSNREFTSQYLSEKTFGLLFAGIPFISTHEYPLQMIEKMLNVPSHPFYNESKKYKTDSKLFAKFVNNFLENFDENYILCKEWSELVHNELMNKIENENSLLNLIINGELKNEFIIKKSLL